MVSGAIRGTKSAGALHVVRDVDPLLAKYTLRPQLELYHSMKKAYGTAGSPQRDEDDAALADLGGVLGAARGHLLSPVKNVLDDPQGHPPLFHEAEREKYNEEQFEEQFLYQMMNTSCEKLDDAALGIVADEDEGGDSPTSAIRQHLARSTSAGHSGAGGKTRGRGVLGVSGEQVSSSNKKSKSMSELKRDLYSRPSSAYHKRRMAHARAFASFSQQGKPADADLVDMENLCRRLHELSLSGTSPSRPTSAGGWTNASVSSYLLASSRATSARPTSGNRPMSAGLNRPLSSQGQRPAPSSTVGGGPAREEYYTYDANYGGTRTNYQDYIDTALTPNIKPAEQEQRDLQHDGGLLNHTTKKNKTIVSGSSRPQSAMTRPQSAVTKGSAVTPSKMSPTDKWRRQQLEGMIKNLKTHLMQKVMNDEKFEFSNTTYEKDASAISTVDRLRDKLSELGGGPSGSSKDETCSTASAGSDDFQEGPSTTTGGSKQLSSTVFSSKQLGGVGGSSMMNHGPGSKTFSSQQATHGGSSLSKTPVGDFHFHRSSSTSSATGITESSRGPVLPSFAEALIVSAVVPPPRKKVVKAHSMSTSSQLMLGDQPGQQHGASCNSLFGDDQSYNSYDDHEEEGEGHVLVGYADEEAELLNALAKGREVPDEERLRDMDYTDALLNFPIGAEYLDEQKKDRRTMNTSTMLENRSSTSLVLVERESTTSSSLDEQLEHQENEQELVYGGQHEDDGQETLFLQDHEHAVGFDGDAGEGDAGAKTFLTDDPTMTTKIDQPNATDARTDGNSATGPASSNLVVEHQGDQIQTKHEAAATFSTSSPRTGKDPEIIAQTKRMAGWMRTLEKLQHTSDAFADACDATALELFKVKSKSNAERAAMHCLSNEVERLQMGESGAPPIDVLTRLRLSRARKSSFSTTRMTEKTSLKKEKTSLVSLGGLEAVDNAEEDAACAAGGGGSGYFHDHISSSRQCQQSNSKTTTSAPSSGFFSNKSNNLISTMSTTHSCTTFAGTRSKMTSTSLNGGGSTRLPSSGFLSSSKFAGMTQSQIRTFSLEKLKRCRPDSSRETTAAGRADKFLHVHQSVYSQGGNKNSRRQMSGDSKDTIATLDLHDQYRDTRLGSTAVFQAKNVREYADMHKTPAPPPKKIPRPKAASVTLRHIPL
ncbi:unnamed protein product [Amoebophrya sp. A25]|nr:unnamed protein product [Amoebophrya sp. A25]|eukprot:GSA25T00017126001.1